MKKGFGKMRKPETFGINSHHSKNPLMFLLLICCTALFSAGCDLEKSDDNGKNMLVVMASALTGDTIPGTEAWDKKIDYSNGSDLAKSIAVDAHGNVYVVGIGQKLVSDSSGTDWWIKKFNAKGVEDTDNWDKKIDNSFADEAASVTVDGEGNVYVAGYGFNLASGSSGPDGWIKKFDANGVEDTVNWDKKIDNENGFEMANSVAVDGEGNVYVAGFRNGIGSLDWWIKKFNVNGVEDTVNWNKTIGNKGFDEATSVAVDADGNVYVAGSGEKLVSDSSSNDWWIKKFNADGVEDTANWNKIFDGNNGDDRARSIRVDADGNVYVAGFGEKLISDSSGNDWWIKKFDADGVEDTVNWDKKIDGNNTDDGANSIAVDANGNVYVAGSWGPDWWIKMFDAGGVEDTLNWDKQFITHSMFSLNSIAIDSHGDVYVAGIGDNLVSDSSGKDWWIKKFYGEQE